MKKVGLVDAHAYTLIGAYEPVSLPGTRLLKIRNPWGFKEWTGDYSDQDTKHWTDDLKTELKFEKKDDGIFYITFSDFLSFFYITTISKGGSGVPNHAFDRDSQDNPHDYSVFKVTLSKESDLAIMAHQISARHADQKLDGRYEYAPIKLMIGKVDEEDEELTFADGDYLMYHCAQVDLGVVPAGSYLVMVKVYWAEVHKCRNIVVNVASHADVTCQRVYSKKFALSTVFIMEEWLGDRMADGKDYERPDLHND